MLGEDKEVQRLTVLEQLRQQIKTDKGAKIAEPPTNLKNTSAWEDHLKTGNLGLINNYRIKEKEDKNNPWDKKDDDSSLNEDAFDNMSDSSSV